MEKEVRMSDKAREERAEFLQIIHNQKNGEDKERVIEEQKR
jgi:hypothetical protein